MSTGKHRKEKQPELTLKDMQRWMVVPGYMPPAIVAGIRALAGTAEPFPPRGRPRKQAKRDALIAHMKDVQKYSFGEIAQKLKIRREVVSSAYYRMKRNAPTGCN